MTNESHQRIDGKYEKTSKAPKIADTIDCECQTFPMEGFGYASRNNIGDTAEMNQLKSYKSFAN